MRTPVFHALALPILSLIVLSNYGHHLCSRILPGDCLLQCTALKTFPAIQPTHGSQRVWCGTPVLGPLLPLCFTPKVWTVTFSRDTWNSELSLSLPTYSRSTGPFHGPLSTQQNSSTPYQPHHRLPYANSCPTPLFEQALFLKSLSLPLLAYSSMLKARCSMLPGTQPMPISPSFAWEAPQSGLIPQDKILSHQNGPMHQRSDFFLI